MMNQTTQMTITEPSIQERVHCLHIPLDGTIHTDEGRYQANIKGTLRNLAYFSDVNCWFTLQETAMGSRLAQPVWRDADGQWQQGSLETLRERPVIDTINWQQISLPPLPVLPISPQPIPHIVHYIWIGDNCIPADLQASMQANTQRCPSYRFLLHAYPHSQKGWRQLKKQFPAQGRIELIDLRQDDEFAPFLTTELGHYYQQFLQPLTLNYGAASDILRLVLLHRKGGIYMDVDDEITVRIEPGHRLLAGKEDLLLSQKLRVDMYDFHGYGNSTFACHAGNALLEAMMQEMQVRLKQADRFFMKPRPWYEADTMVNEEKKHEMLTYLKSIFFLTGPVLFSEVLERLAGEVFHIERNLIRAYQILNVSPTEPRIIADDYLETFHAAKQYYQPFSDPSFNVCIGTAHSWNPRSGKP